MSYLLAALAVIYLLWVLYLAVMTLKRARDAGLLTPLTKAMGYPVLFVGYSIDAIVNILPMTLIFFDLPEELTLTSRLKRHIRQGGWRGRMAGLFRPLLDPFDPSGKHI